MMYFLGMFTYDKKAGVHWFSSAQCETYQEFNLVGVVSFFRRDRSHLFHLNFVYIFIVYNFTLAMSV